jgi:hypothetical protein
MVDKRKDEGNSMGFTTEHMMASTYMNEFLIKPITQITESNVDYAF